MVSADGGRGWGTLLVTMLRRNKQQRNRIHTNICVRFKSEQRWSVLAKCCLCSGHWLCLCPNARPVPGHTNWCSLVFLCISSSFVHYFSLNVNTVVWQPTLDYPAGFTCFCGTQECMNLLVGAEGKYTLFMNLTVRRIEVPLSQRISFWPSQYNSLCLKEDTHRLYEGSGYSVQVWKEKPVHKLAKLAFTPKPGREQLHWLQNKVHLYRSLWENDSASIWFIVPGKFHNNCFN